MSNSNAWSDTIVALATPPGIGALGVIRLSGLRAIDIANNLFPGKDLHAVATHTLHVGVLRNGEEKLDEVVLSVFRGPKSYTGEDVIEISCHGSPYIQERVIDACVGFGARLARPGEFTQRAFLNGRLDLSQAESVADLIASNTDASHRAALHGLRGGISDSLKALRERMIRFSALIELELDFSQEDVEFADRKAFHTLIDELTESTNRLIDSFRLGNVIRNGVSVAIVGRPNAGKSTLLNALLQEDRAIVSEIPGTTRDTIEEVLNIDGILFRLIDTAGIREHTSDVIESAGMARSLGKMRAADLVLYLFDAADDPREIEKFRATMDQEKLNYLMLSNKIDQLKEGEAEAKFADRDRVIFLSAKRMLNLETLKKRMMAVVMEGTVKAENTIITNARHYHALKEVQLSLLEIRAGLQSGIPGDLLALDIRRCLHYLGEITGEVNNEEMLDYIFSKFCIGK